MTGEDDAVAFSIGPEDAEDAVAGEGFAEVVVSGFGGIGVSVGEEFEGERIFERLLDVLGRDSGEVKGDVYPIEFHETRGAKRRDYLRY